MDMLNVSLITMAWELYCHEVPQVRIASDIGRNRDTVRLWISGIKEHGLMKFLDLYEGAKRGKRSPRKANTEVKIWVWETREREIDCCGQKIQYFLEKEHSTKISVPKIYEVLKEKYVIKSKWKKNKKRGPVPEAHKSREVIQMDSVDFGGVFAFTAVDIYSREADIILRPSLTSQDGIVFLDTAMKRGFNSHSHSFDSIR